jgi:5-methylcytosine-specific restriction endonuclease McrA
MPRRKFSSAERAFIIRRAYGCCEYCRTPLDFSPESFDVEHIIPLPKGGTNELENLALSCGGCNGRKRDRVTATDPKTKVNTRFLIHAWIVGVIISSGTTTFQKLQASRGSVVQHWPPSN